MPPDRVPTSNRPSATCASASERRARTLPTSVALACPRSSRPKRGPARPASKIERRLHASERRQIERDPHAPRRRRSNVVRVVRGFASLALLLEGDVARWPGQTSPFHTNERVSRTSSCFVNIVDAASGSAELEVDIAKPSGNGGRGPRRLRLARQRSHRIVALQRAREVRFVEQTASGDRVRKSLGQFGRRCTRARCQWHRRRDRRRASGSRRPVPRNAACSKRAAAVKSSAVLCASSILSATAAADGGKRDAGAAEVPAVGQRPRVANPAGRGSASAASLQRGQLRTRPGRRAHRRRRHRTGIVVGDRRYGRHSRNRREPDRRGRSCAGACGSARTASSG